MKNNPMIAMGKINNLLRLLYKLEVIEIDHTDFFRWRQGSYLFEQVFFN